MRMTSYPEHNNGRIRTAVFSSYYRGYYVLDELLSGPLSAHVTVVGVATDNPANTFISRAKRVWQYPHTETEANLVRDRAQLQGLPVFDGRVKGKTSATSSAPSGARTSASRPPSASGLTTISSQRRRSASSISIPTTAAPGPRRTPAQSIRGHAAGRSL